MLIKIGKGPKEHLGVYHRVPLATDILLILLLSYLDDFPSFFYFNSFV